LFSFNNPIGACPTCKGFGKTLGLDLRKAMPDESLSIADGLVRAFVGNTYAECQTDLITAALKRGEDIHRGADTHEVMRPVRGQAVPDVIKDGELVDTHELSASKRVYKVGRQAGVADIVLTHGSISREHATITVSASGSVVVVDLGSAQGTKISGKPLVPNKPHLLPPGRSLTFGQSTRTFKLREGGSGFVSGEAGAAAVARAPQGAASLDDPRVQPVLQVLRAGASDCERPRPDGVMRLMSVVASVWAARSWSWRRCPRGSSQVFETITEAGVLLLRALDGHEPSLRVQPRLQLVPDPSPPSILFFGSTFREWNAVRSNGVGAGRTPPGPIFLSAHPPPLGAKPLGAKLGSLAAAPAPRMARKFLATRAAAAHRENMLSEGLSFLLLSVRPSTEAGLGVAAHMQSVSSCQGKST
jgi:hypothetical protein